MTVQWPDERNGLMSTNPLRTEPRDKQQFYDQLTVW